ncbi:DUF1642 domain-containing protein [Carnobacterium sp. PL17GRE32]|uniref:DUF1642 domain-containing protein n=1 Tax=Carnobacterium sp. PL17GRE32 TaxID=2592355 RepID=UPI0011F00B55|nr:DUF1642 domain-containing protein [Carnobacterium sp. PL17GRE32]KAF3306016.1 DUF1642 domain-containing protein [Carnobacterium sp. PL17GRE32]
MKIEIEKPVVPQWFDDWYKTFGGNKTNALYFLNRAGRGHALTYFNGRKVEDYFDRLYDLSGDGGFENAQEYLSKAILHGYDIEQEPLYYAKIKGWELATTTIVFWNYRHIVERPILSKLYVGGKESIDSFKTKMTIEQWNKIGIYDTNADFEEVE